MKKVIEKLKSDKERKQLLKIFIDHNIVIFPFLWALAFTFSVVEVFTYSGFIGRHIFFGTKFFLFLCFFSGILSRLYQPKRLKVEASEHYKILSIINRLSFLPLIAITLIIMFIELSHYPNYVFATFHIQPQNLYWACFLSFFLILLNLVDYFESRFTIPVQTKEYLLTLALVLGLLLVVVEFDLYRIGGGVGKNLFYLTKHPFASYDQKMIHFWGDYYNYMVFVRENTPEDAAIMVPAQKTPWLTVGNRALAKYFLYPRTLLHNKEDPYGKTDPQSTHVMIAWGTWAPKEGDPWYGWPKEKVLAELIIYKKKDSTEIEKRLENTTYDPEDEINNEAWGIIQVKRE